MKILYLKGYKWLLSQKQQVRNDFLVVGGTTHRVNLSLTLWMPRTTASGTEVLGDRAPYHVQKTKLF